VANHHIYTCVVFVLPFISDTVSQFSFVCVYRAMYAVVLVLCLNFAGIMCSNFNLSFNSNVHCAIIRDREALTLCVHVA